MPLKTMMWTSAAAAALTAQGALAQSERLQQRAVVGGVSYAQPAPPPEALRDRPLEEYAMAGGVAAVDSRPASDYLDNYANDAGEAFFFAPGVWVNALDLNEPRIAIRGFGLANRQERSTAPIFRDGAPLTDVHGGVNIREIDLRAVSRVDVMRGGAGDLRFVGDSLSGAVNFVSPTGRTAGYGRMARADVGLSIDGEPGGRLHAAAAGVSRGGNVDYFVSLSGGYETGFRENNELREGVLNANLGYRISQSVETRFFLDAIYSDAGTAGGLTPALLDDDPARAAPPISLGPLFPGGPIIELADGAEADEFGRKLLNGRIANETTFRLFGHDIESGFHFARRDVESPQIDFVGVLEETGNEWGVRLAVKRALQFLGMDASYRLGGAYSAGAQDSDRFENLDGDKGDQFVDSRHKSSNVTAFVEAAFEPFRRLLVDVGAKFIMTDRELTVDDDDFEELRFTGVAAKGGAAFDLNDNVQLFANAARTYEPPSFSELISDNPTEFNDLEEQDAFTYEAGLRGRLGDRVGWNIVYFNADVENEIINIEEPETNGIGDTLVNAAKTTHKGVEVGLDIELLGSQSGNGAGLVWRSAYSYNDFTFVDADPLDDIDGNRIAGVPEHLYRGELRYDAAGRWFAAVNVELGAGAFYADHENAVSAPTYTAVGFSAGLKLNENLEVFASGENLTDAKYAAGITPVLSQTSQNARLFTPAQRATLYGGLTYRF